MEENIKGASQVHGVSGSEIIRYVNEQYPQALRHVTPYFGYGVTQDERAPQALTPKYAPIDGRSLEDLMALAVKLSKNYTYFNEDLHPDGNWESFLKKDVISKSFKLLHDATYSPSLSCIAIAGR